jgi:hypothetical protein
MLLETFLSTEMGRTLLAPADDDEAAGDNDSESDGEPDVIDRFLIQTVQVRRRTLMPRGARCLKGMIKLSGEFQPLVDKMIEGSDVTFLEVANIGTETLREYLRMVGLFCGSSPISKELLRNATAMDASLVMWMNAQLVAGRQPRGDENVTAVMALCPAYPKAGALALRRSIRCLKGWRRFCPARSKYALKSKLAKMGYVCRGLGVSMIVVCCLRVRELLSLKLGQILRPTGQGLQALALLLFPIERMATSRTGATVETATSGSPRIQLLNPVFDMLARLNPQESLVDMAYIDFYRSFTQAATALSIPVTASMTQGSGASMDRAAGLNTFAEIQRLSRLAARKSVVWYEKPTRLNQSLSALSESRLEQFLEKARSVLKSFNTSTQRLPTVNLRSAAATTSLSRVLTPSTRVAVASTGGAPFKRPSISC